MEKESKYSKNLRVRVDPELYELAKQEAKRLNTDMSTYIRWCIRTGLYLKDVNKVMKSKSDEP
jgi:predicted HicB family RNase H-like nuclease